MSAQGRTRTCVNAGATDGPHADARTACWYSRGRPLPRGRGATGRGQFSPVGFAAPEADAGDEGKKKTGEDMLA